MSGPRDHSALGASNAHRWVNCPGSVEAEAGLPDEESPYAQEGTAAHALAHLALVKQQHPSKWLGEEIEGIVVTQDMVDGVAVYVDYVREIQQKANTVWFEQKFDLSPLQPPVPMFGTADFAAVSWGTETVRLDVVDLKYGRGVKVVAQGNVQAMYYALGTYVELAKQNYALSQRISEITLHIVQPRILDEEGEPTITTDTITLLKLKGFARELLEAARRTQQQNPARVAGEHCRFCKAKATCPAYRTRALAVAKTEFSDLVEDKVKLPAPGELTPDQIAKVLDHRGLLRDWLESVEGYALGELERGRPIPGYSRKPKRAIRKWRSEQAVVEWAEKEYGATTEDLYDLKIKSPAQIEKLTGKGTIPGELITAESSGFNLCKADDPLALPPVVADFEPVD